MPCSLATSVSVEDRAARFGSRNTAGTPRVWMVSVSLRRSASDASVDGFGVTKPATFMW
ncbi:hypothetical protein HEB94_000936 [Actinopolymorpha pittospori]|uniref:Uncharacterized protein n=1 Tax=Actinopolymorpha pittospori TaxID=648752 RepID=A0A927MRV6_9ACTN|nr:hypothetical protein [Actinopolymorpha pittospori]